MSEKKMMTTHFIEKGERQCQFCCVDSKDMHPGASAVVYNILDDYYRVYRFNRHGFEYIPCILSSDPKI